MTSAPDKIRLLIADDQPVILRGLSLMLGAEKDVEVVGQAKDGVEAVEMAKELHPDVVIMDLQMPNLSGIDATRAITKMDADIKIVVLTTFASDNLVFDAMRVGARAYLLKDTDEQKVLTTVRAVHRGDAVLTP